MSDPTSNPESPLLIVNHDGHVALVQLHRPKVRNALNLALMGELADVLESLDRDDSTRVIILTGYERAFAAGADISEMAHATATEMHSRPNL